MTALFGWMPRISKIDSKTKKEAPKKGGFYYAYISKRVNKCVLSPLYSFIV
jgi:hypothetical protein